MGNFSNYCKEHLKLIIFLIIIVFIILGITISINFDKFYKKVNRKTEEVVALAETEEKQEEVKEIEVKKVTIDIKGAIVNPGVYELEENKIVNDVINMAGGLTKNADTSNINLSRKVKDEMVIIIYTKKELQDQKKEVKDDCSVSDIYIDNCYNEKKSIVISDSENSNIKNSTSSENAKISINTASKEKLMQLSGIGESKADNIIQYRQEHGNFKNLEELMSINGIGEAVFAKIKDHITL